MLTESLPNLQRFQNGVLEKRETKPQLPVRGAGLARFRCTTCGTTVDFVFTEGGDELDLFRAFTSAHPWQIVLSDPRQKFCETCYPLAKAARDTPSEQTPELGGKSQANQGGLW